MNCIPTTEGLKQVRKPYIKWDSINIDTGSGKIVFMRKGVAVAFMSSDMPIREADTITITGISGKIEVDVR